MAPGLEDAVLDSQSLFRAVLEALSRPGRIVSTGTTLNPPSPLHPSSAAIALSLFDLSTPYWLDPALRSSGVSDFIQFHTGAGQTDDPSRATFAIADGRHGSVDWSGFAIGTPEYPDRSTTVIVQVEAFQEDGAIRLSGPGIQTQHHLGVSGLNQDFWSARQDNAALYPLGIDAILTTPHSLVGLPRTTQVSI